MSQSYHYERQVRHDLLGAVASDSGYELSPGGRTSRIEQLVCAGWKRHSESSPACVTLTKTRRVLHVIYLRNHLPIDGD